MCSVAMSSATSVRVHVPRKKKVVTGLGGDRIRRWRITIANHTTQTYLGGPYFDSGDIIFLFYGARLVYLSFLWKPQYLHK